MKGFNIYGDVSANKKSWKLKITVKNMCTFLKTYGIFQKTRQSIDKFYLLVLCFDNSHKPSKKNLKIALNKLKSQKAKMNNKFIRNDWNWSV